MTVQRAKNLRPLALLLLSITLVGSPAGSARAQQKQKVERAETLDLSFPSSRVASPLSPLSCSSERCGDGTRCHR